MTGGIHRCARLLVSAVVLVSLPGGAVAQQAVTQRGLALEVEPVAYALGGAGGTVAYRHGPWSASIEAFTLTVPESLHGNAGFEASTAGGELQAERFLGRSPDGFYLGAEVGVSRLEVTHRKSGATEKRFGVSVGARFGYEWRTGIGGLYLSPVAGVSYSLASDEVSVRGDSFERTPVTPWGTVGIGWQF